MIYLSVAGTALGIAGILGALATALRSIRFQQWLRSRRNEFHFDARVDWWQIDYKRKEQRLLQNHYALQTKRYIAVGLVELIGLCAFASVNFLG